MAENANGRTHEPNLRELTAELDGVKALLVEKMESLRREYLEVHRRYEDRFKSMSDMTNLALTASKEAVTKAEVATEKRFESVNEFRSTLADQAKEFMRRQEYITSNQAMIDKVDLMKEVFSKEIRDLREYRSEMGGEKTALHGVQAQSNWSIGVAVAVALSLFSAVVTLFGIMMRWMSVPRP